MRGYTGFGNGHHLHLYMEIGPLVDDDACFAFFGNVEVGCIPVTGAVARHNVMFLMISELADCCNEENESRSTRARCPIMNDSFAAG
jgi:hypothetical protein